MTRKKRAPQQPLENPPDRSVQEKKVVRMTDPAKLQQERPIRVVNKIGYVVDPPRARDLFARMLRACERQRLINEARKNEENARRKKDDERLPESE